MLIENLLGEFSLAQAITGGGASSHYLNLDDARQQVGVGGQLWLWLRTNVAEDFGESETFLFAFEVDDNSSFSSPKCVFAICDADGTKIATADPESTPLKTAGATIFAGSLPYTADEQYARWNYAHTTGTAVLAVDAFLLAGPPPLNLTRSQVFVSNVGNP